MAELLEALAAFPVGYILNLGGGFPTASYAFSETRFSEAERASRRDFGVKVTTFLLILFVRHQADRQTTFIKAVQLVGSCVNTKPRNKIF